MAGFYEASLAIERDRKMEELANIVDQSPNLSSVEILRLAARSGLVDNPNMSAILQQKIQQEQGLKQAQQTQEGVNLRSDLFGQQQPQPEQQAQQDIQQMTGGKQPSLFDGFSQQPGAEAGGAGLQAPQGMSLAPPGGPEDLMSKFQVPQPAFMDMPEMRKEALDAGMLGSEVDMMLSEMRAGNMGAADFDDKIAKAITAKTKKKEAAQKAESMRLKEAANRLRQAQKDFIIYERESGRAAESIDYNRPDDYVVSQERRTPLATKHISEQRGGRGGKEATSSKLLNNLIDERTKVLTQMNKLRKQVDLDPKVAEAEGIDKTQVNKLYQQNVELYRNLTGQINELQGTVETKKATQDVKIPKSTKPKYTREEYIEALKKRGKSPETIDKFLRSRGLGGMYN